LALLDILIPQMGEGLQEVVIVGFQKEPGDRVRRDEPLYSMETDKAVMDMESPFDGVLTEWLASAGDVLPVGAPIARVEIASESADVDEVEVVNEQYIEPNPVVDHSDRYLSDRQAIDRQVIERSGAVVPPRTRALCRERGISEDEMYRIPYNGSKLMPADVDAYLVASAISTTGGDTVESAEPVPGIDQSEYVEQPVLGQQRVFNSRVRRSVDLVVTGTMTRPMRWTPVTDRVRKEREQDFTFRPTAFQTFAWCVAQAIKSHPKMRSTLLGDETVRIYKHLNLGIAVARDNGELVTAVVRNADTLEYRDFVREIQASIDLARQGDDQADSATQFLLTYLGGFDIIEAIPVLVAPAIGVLFLGGTYPREGEPWSNLTLTFDHRLINGVEGAVFLKSIVETAYDLAEAP